MSFKLSALRNAWRSIAIRTTIIILGLGVILSFVFAWLGAPLLFSYEQKRTHDQFEDILSTVQSTVSIACFTGDSTLAMEIARGLMTNKPVAAVRVISDDKVIAALPELQSGERWPAAEPISRVVSSPFDDRQMVGRIELVPDESFIRYQASIYSGYITDFLKLQIVVVSLIVALVVVLSIVRPIKRISDELHHLEADHGERLALPAGNEHNEIGRLAEDVNGLIGKLVGLLNSEQDARREQALSERKFRLIVENAELGILLLNQQGVVESLNPAVERMLCSNHIGIGSQLPLDDFIRQKISAGQSHREDIPIQGSDRWVQLVLHALGDGLTLGILIEITERKQKEAHALTMAERDLLTNTYNRRGVDHRLQWMFSQYKVAVRDWQVSHNQFALPEPSPFAVMLIDLDRFKQVNDTYGHDAGDEVLCQVVRRLELLVRQGDVIGRLGGDEFVLLLPDMRSMQAAEQLRTLLVAGICEPMELSSGITVAIGASIGIAIASVDDDSSAVVLQRADQAMYGIKHLHHAIDSA